MAKEALTDKQVSQIIDFLKRWGIDSPELVYELTDHYCEKALEQMTEGKSFQQVLDSWKTKPHFLSLKKIQKEFEENFKKQWVRSQKAASLKIFTSKQIFILIGFVGIVQFAIWWDLGVFLFGFSIAQFFAYILIMAYFFWIKKWSRIIELRDGVTAYVIYCTVFQFYLSSTDDGYLPEETIFQVQTLYSLLFLGTTVFLYNLYKQSWVELKGITQEYLDDPETNPRLR
ncbi:MAG: hypothetical protein AAGC47_05300 [Bacteroidota bacterium]